MYVYHNAVYLLTHNRILAEIRYYNILCFLYTVYEPSAVTMY